MSLRDQLQTIYSTHQALTPRLVVGVAADPDHPLHERFEWDDTIAGPKYREVQAAELIRSVHIKFVPRQGGEPVDVRAFHAIPRADDSSYVPIEEVAADEFSRQILLRSAEREWKSLRRKYAHLTEFVEMVRGDLGDPSAA